MCSVYECQNTGSYYFVVIAVLTFVTSSFWGIEAVAVSIVVPLAIALDANVLLALGAVVSGGVFGSHACFYSDATVLFPPRPARLTICHMPCRSFLTS